LSTPTGVEEGQKEGGNVERKGKRGQAKEPDQYDAERPGQEKGKKDQRKRKKETGCPLGGPQKQGDGGKKETSREAPSKRPLVTVGGRGRKGKVTRREDGVYAHI